MHGERWHSEQMSDSEDTGHQAQGAAGAEPEECARLSFQHSGFDTVDALGLNEIL